MNKQLHNQLNELKNVAPAAAWKVDAKRQLLQQIEGSARPAIAGGWLVMARDLTSAWFSAAARPAYALTAMAMVMLVGGLFSISAASEATPGSLLYTAKLIGEKTQFALVREPEDKVRMHAVLAERRAHELSLLSAADTAQVSAVAAHLMEEVNAIKTKLSEIERDQPQAALAIAREVESQTRQLRLQLESTRKTVASDAQQSAQTLDEAIDSVGATEFAALRTIASTQSANKTQRAEVEHEVGGKVADKIAAAKEKAAAAAVENDRAVFSAGLVRTEQNIQTSATMEARSKTEAANQAITEAESLFEQDNYTEALDKLSESAVLLDEAAAARQEADAQNNTDTETGTSTPGNATSSADASAQGEVHGEVSGERATSTGE
jgi:hypothetical protein